MEEMIKKHIVIVGAGFGGVTAALKLEWLFKKKRQEYEIILVDRHHHQLYTPTLYEIASIPREMNEEEYLKSSILIPISDIIGVRAITFICDECIGFDVSQKTITLRQLGALSYEFLILALGSETNYFNIPGLQQYSFSLKTFDDAMKLRNNIQDAAKTKEGYRIVIGGAGATGVELAAEFVNFICSIQKQSSVHTLCNVEFLLVEAAPDILSGFDPSIVKKVRTRLERLGVRIKTNSSISRVSADIMEFRSGEREQYDILIWTGGVRGPSLFSACGLPLSAKGSLHVNEYLQIAQNRSNIYAIGDSCSFVHPVTGKPLAWNVPAAEAEARHAAVNIARIIAAKDPLPFRPAKKYPFVLAVGSKYAIADLVFARFSGLLGWIIKQLVGLRYLMRILPLSKACKIWWRSLTVSRANDVSTNT